MNSLFERLLSTSEVMEALSDRHFVRAMLHFEAALARAQASVGLIPQTASASIVGTCKVELFDVLKLVREAGSARSATQPLVKSLRETVGLFNPEAERYVHFACSDQDLADTAQVLITRDGLDLISADLSHILTRLQELADSHATTPMLARSPLQASTITTFGLKCVQWAAPLQRAQQRLGLAADKALSLQFGSLAGPQAELQGKGQQMLALMASELKLKAPSLPWRTQRDEWVALACELALLVASLASLAQNMLQLAQYEVAELTPPDNSCSVALAAAQRMPQCLSSLLLTLAQDHDGGLGHWQAALAEWPTLLMSTHGATRAMALALTGLQVNTDQMRSHLEARRAAAPSREPAALFAPELAQQAAELARQHLLDLHAITAS
ncbi:lyase family protein [Rhodoferax sp. BLA1]|uniref:lyase family protein n=1 Tax=Rhodoferax sp. BLA1 TaxID=2576062 RepID=UPI0015D3D3F0|nr:lyase family protein [Rhodoferax sp. BLA1]